MFQCNQCDKSFEHLFQLISHRSSHVTFLDEEDEAKFCCEKCNKIFSEHHLYVQHLQNVDGCLHVSNEEPKRESIFFRNQCSKGFPEHTLYVRHVEKHVDVENKCSICSKVLASQRNLKDHLRLMHTRETPFHCGTCNKPFLRKDKLTKHELTHKNWLICTKCGEIFSTKQLLKIHGRIHPIIKPFKCPRCPKKYTRDQHLQTHLKSHSSELEHSCPYCNQQFWRDSHLEKHIKIHKYDVVKNECACAVCGMFVGATLLKEHMEKEHQGANKFRCKFYDKIFSKKVHLTFHMKTHPMN